MRSSCWWGLLVLAATGGAEANKLQTTAVPLYPVEPNNVTFNEWNSLLPAINSPAARTAQSAATVDEYMYIFGGWVRNQSSIYGEVALASSMFGLAFSPPLFGRHAHCTSNDRLQRLK